MPRQLLFANHLHLSAPDFSKPTVNYPALGPEAGLNRHINERLKDPCVQYMPFETCDNAQSPVHYGYIKYLT